MNNILCMFLFFIIPYTSFVYNKINTNFIDIFENISSEKIKQEFLSTYNGINVLESNLSAEDIDTKKYEYLKDNNIGNFINNTFYTRQKYDITKESNIIFNTQNSIENNIEVVDKNYSDCKNNIYYKICYNKGKNNLINTSTYNKICNTISVVKCGNYYTNLKDNVNVNISVINGSYLYENGIFKLNSSNYSNINIIANIDIGNINGINIYLNKSGYVHNPVLIINGNRVVFDENNITKYFKNGKNTMQIYEKKCGTSSHKSYFDFRLSLNGIVCKEIFETVKENCNISNYHNCSLIELQCIEPNKTKSIDGLDIFKKCWNVQKKYQCIKTKEHNEDCSNMDLNGCIIDNVKIIGNNTTQYVYKCIKNTDISGLCNQKIQCINGECYNLENTQNNLEDMLYAISVLSTINESSKTISNEDLTMLNGENLKCSKSTSSGINFKDCCGSDNWGNNFGNCSFEENKLKEKKDNSSCIFVGSYCSEEINIGFDKVCLEQKYSYCCFNNKFSKILANATRQQGLQNWGSPKNTNCSGILIEHLSLIDFNKINFNELYDDIKNSTNKEEIYKNIQYNLEKIKNGIN